MKQYLDLLQDIKQNGTKKTNRTGVDTLSVFGRQQHYNLAEGFPAVTTKKLFLRSVIHELLWFLQGSTNIKYLVDNDVHIWDEWPYKAYLQKQGKNVPKTGSEEWNTGIGEFIAKIKTDGAFARDHGELGPVYGHQWRHWPAKDGGEIDQITHVIDQIIKVAKDNSDPDSRRLIVSAWNVADLEEMAIAGIPPCHSLFQFYVLDGKLSCQLYQRSADVFLGAPFNIASYAMLTMMVAQVTGLKLGEFIHTMGDAHLYVNHLAQVDEQLSRKPKPAPTLWINPKITSIFDFTINDFELRNYDPYPAIKAPIAV